ncbi:MAG: peptidase [Marmoricola sp.]|nr:peptidase [Marmoricola sp.]
MVAGRSMEPTLRAGDRLIVRYGAPVAVDDLVLARFADGTLAVKRVAYAAVTGTSRPGWFLLSDNADEGVDSRHRGPLAAEDVIAVVRAKVWRLRRQVRP